MAESTAEKVKRMNKKHGCDAVNKPKRTPDGPKKFAVLAKEGDTVKLVRFGDLDMRTKKGNAERKKSYCARSGGIKGKDSKLSANYWSRKKWDC